MCTETISLEERLDRLVEKAVQKVKDKIIKDLFKELIDVVKIMAIRLDELTARVNELTDRVNELTDRVNELTARVNELTDRVNELTDRVNELTDQMKYQSGRLTEIDGKISEWRTIDMLKGIFNRYGLGVYASVYAAFDAYAIGDNFLVVIEICKSCRKEKVDQVKRATGVAMDKLGMKPNAYVVFVLGDLVEEVVEYGRKLGVIVENSPVRLAKALNDIIRRGRKS